MSTVSIRFPADPDKLTVWMVDWSSETRRWTIQKTREEARWFDSIGALLAADTIPRGVRTTVAEILRASDLDNLPEWV